MSTNVNDGIAPPEPMPAPAPAPAPEMVSVNARGARKNRIAARAVAFALIGAGLAALALYGLAQYRAYDRRQQADALARAKAENKSALVSHRREFSSDPPATPKPPPVEPARPAAKEPPFVPAPIPVIRSPQVPAVVPAPVKPPNRYGGEIIVPQKHELAQAEQSVMPWLQPAGKPHGAADPALQEAQARQTAALSRAQSMLNMRPVGFTDAAVPPTAPAASRPAKLAQADAGDERMLSPDPSAASPRPSTPRALRERQEPDEPPSTQGQIGALLQPQPAARVRATMLGNRNFILPKGRTIDCSLATRVVNETSGYAECVLSMNVYSDNGQVLLLERGSQASGEYVAAMVQGQRRLFLLWTRVRTPNGIVINLASPAADALGTSGLPGYVDNRWGERLGAAVLLSMVQDAIGIAAAHSVSNASNATAGIYTFQNTRTTGERMVNQVLAQTIGIKPTLYKNQGDRASIYVARDLDFETVYALRTR